MKSTSLSDEMMITGTSLIQCRRFIISSTPKPSIFGMLMSSITRSISSFFFEDIDGFCAVFCHDIFVFIAEYFLKEHLVHFRIVRDEYFFPLNS